MRELHFATYAADWQTHVRVYCFVALWCSLYIFISKRGWDEPLFEQWLSWFSSVPILQNNNTDHYTCANIILHQSLLCPVLVPHVVSIQQNQIGRWHQAIREVISSKSCDGLNLTKYIIRENRISLKIINETQWDQTKYTRWVMSVIRHVKSTALSHCEKWRLHLLDISMPKQPGLSMLVGISECFSSMKIFECVWWLMTKVDDTLVKTDRCHGLSPVWYQTIDKPNLVSSRNHGCTFIKGHPCTKICVNTGKTPFPGKFCEIPTVREQSIDCLCSSTRQQVTPVSLWMFKLVPRYGSDKYAGRCLSVIFVSPTFVVRFSCNDGAVSPPVKQIW